MRIAEGKSDITVSMIDKTDKKHHFLLTEISEFTTLEIYKLGMYHALRSQKYAKSLRKWQEQIKGKNK
jgi:hypothetical protein